MACRDDAGIGKAGFLRYVLMPLDDDYFVSGRRQKIGSADADHAPADYSNLLLCHLLNLSMLNREWRAAHNGRMGSLFEGIILVVAASGVRGMLRQTSRDRLPRC